VVDAIDFAAEVDCSLLGAHHAFAHAVEGVRPIESIDGNFTEIADNDGFRVRLLRHPVETKARA
jgi:hypothetical protein